MHVLPPICLPSLRLPLVFACAEWDLDTSKIELELEYVERRGQQLIPRTKTFKLCSGGGIEVFPSTPTFAYRAFTLCAPPECPAGEILLAEGQAPACCRVEQACGTTCCDSGQVCGADGQTCTTAGEWLQCLLISLFFFKAGHCQTF